VTFSWGHGRPHKRNYMREQWQIYWRDYYEILQVIPTAETVVIDGAYRRLAGKYHPDKGVGDDERIKYIVEAYSTLRDESKRREYDLEYRKRQRVPSERGLFTLAQIFSGRWRWWWTEPNKLGDDPKGGSHEVAYFDGENTYVQLYASYDPSRTLFERRRVEGPIFRSDSTVSWKMVRPTDNWYWKMEWTVSSDGRSFRGFCYESVGVRAVCGEKISDHAA